MDRLLIPFGTWPTFRDPNRPPFLVEEYQRGNYRIVGTFPDGVVSLAAVPAEYRLAHQPISVVFVALLVAAHLNDLHARGEIDWEPDIPRMRKRKEWERHYPPSPGQIHWRSSY